MVRFLCRRVGLVALCTLAAALPVSAAGPVSAAELEKYLPDDTAFVLSVNVKQILASPAFTAQYQKQVEDLLKMEPVPTILKDSGIDPLKDVDRVVLTMAKSLQRTDVDPNTGAVSSVGGGPMVLVQGRFDAAKLQAKAEQVIKDFPGFLKIDKKGAKPIYEISENNRPIYFVVLVDPSTLVAAPIRVAADKVVDRATGKTHAQFENPELPKTLKALDPKRSIEVVGLRGMIVGTSISSRSENGKTTTEVKHTTLADSGFKGFHGGATIDKDVQVKFVLTAKDAAKAKEFAKNFEEGVKKGIQEIGKQFPGDEGFAALVEAMKTVKIQTQNDTVTIEGKGDAKAGPALIKALFMRPVHVGPEPAAVEIKEAKPPQPQR